MGFNSGKIKVESSAKKKTNPFGKDVIVDPAGQWKYPGQVTKVPSSNITMNGVPYPVYGMDELGNGQMMYPGMDYQFPGNMVTEYPMMQNGGATLNTVIKPAPPKEKSFEDRVNYYLGDPMTKARKIAEMSAEGGNDAVDNIRHPLAGMYTTEALMNKGLDPMTAFMGSNALGVAHEIANPNRDKGMSWWNTIREGAEDAFNNMVGAGIGVMPGLTDAEKIQMIQRLSYANKLPDGYDYPLEKGRPPNMYFKQYGGEEMELTDEEVEEFRKGGYVVEEYQYGGQSTDVNMPAYNYDPNPAFFEDHPSGVPTPTPQARVRNKGTLEKTVAQPLLNKAYDVVSNPMTALANSRNGIPDNIGQAVRTGNLERNPLEMAVDVVNPAAYANLAGDTYNAVEQGNYGSAAFNAATMIPGLGNVARASKQVVRRTPQVARNVLSYGDDFVKASKSAGRPQFPTYKQVARWEPDVIPNYLTRGSKTLTPEQQALTGSWYTHRPTDLEFYAGSRPGPGTVKVLRMSDTEIADLERQMSGAAKGMSGKSARTQSATSNTFEPGELNVPAARRADAKEIRFDINPTEYIPQSLGYTNASPMGRMVTGEFMNSMVQGKPRIMGLPRKYFPYQTGGELELTDEEVEEYRRGGFIVEELPKAQVGYNTPEYNEAYNQGTVTRYNPQTDTYQGQTLPTFEISAKDTRVADAVRSATDEFAKDYVYPAAKMAAGFTPLGPLVGLTDAGIALSQGDTFGGVMGAGMEALPYGIGKGLKALKKSGALNKAGNTLKDFTQGKVIPEYGKRWKELTPTQQNEYVAEAYRKLDMKYGLDHPNAVNTSASYKGPESSDVIDMLVDRDFGDYHLRSTNDLWQSKVNNLSPEELKAFEKDYFNRDKILKDIAHANVGDEAISNIHTNSLPNPLELIDKVTPMPSIQQLITFGMPVGNRTTLSPLNLMPGYGKVMKGKGQVFRKFGNSMADVQKRKMFGPSGGSKYRMGRDQIVSEGNWGNLGDFDEQYSGVFGAKVDPNVKGTNLGYKGWHDRNGVLITDSSGQLLPDVPISDPGLSFHRRLPFSNRYATIDKQKLIDDKFQLATQLPYLQSLSEKYVTGLGIAGIAGGLGINDAIDTYNDYTINPILDFGKKTYDKLKEEIDFKDGGEIMELTEAQVKALKKQGFIIENV